MSHRSKKSQKRHEKRNKGIAKCMEAYVIPRDTTLDGLALFDVIIEPFFPERKSTLNELKTQYPLVCAKITKITTVDILRPSKSTIRQINVAFEHRGYLEAEEAAKHKAVIDYFERVYYPSLKRRWTSEFTPREYKNNWDRPVHFLVRNNPKHSDNIKLQLIPQTDEIKPGTPLWKSGWFILYSSSKITSVNHFGASLEVMAS
jgi:hypothetical protein